MVTLYTWLPAPAGMIFESGKMPDIGHSALWARTDDAEAYVSFWPETDSLIGRVTALWAPRAQRCPAGYAEECAPDGPYLQRPADYADDLPALDARRIIRGWPLLQDSPYQATTWNCSHVTRCLLTLAMSPEAHARLVATGALAEEQPSDNAPDMLARLGLIAAERLADSTPLTVRTLALAYVDSVRNDSTS